MELLLTDEQKLLQDSAATFVERAAGPKRVRELRDREPGFDRAVWTEIARDAGWLGIMVPESAGGLGLGATELALVLEQGGRGLLMEPVCAASASARAIAEGDNAALHDKLLPAVLDGRQIVVPALQEGVNGIALDGVATEAKPKGKGFALTGKKRFVPSAAGADGFLVNARGPGGAILCYVPRAASGIKIDNAATVDGSGLGTIALNGVEVPAENVVVGANLAPEVTARMMDLMLIGLSAELLGVMNRALEIALEYLKVRKQFDRPIGSFQALQHRAVNDYIQVELTRSLLFQVCGAMDGGRGSTVMASAVKARSSGAGLSVTKSAIQMHGAIGFTDEHDIGLYLKRAMALSAHYGNEAAHRGRYARLSGIEPSA